MSAYRCQHCGCSCGACELPDSTCRTRDAEALVAELRATLDAARKELEGANAHAGALWLELVEARERLRAVQRAEEAAT